MKRPVFLSLVLSPVFYPHLPALSDHGIRSECIRSFRWSLLVDTAACVLGLALRTRVPYIPPQFTLPSRYDSSQISDKRPLLHKSATFLTP